MEFPMFSHPRLVAAALVTTLATACSYDASEAASQSELDAVSGRGTLVVQPYAAEGAGFHVTSNLILGATEAVLVDAQFTRSEAKKVAAKVRASGRELTTVFVTHGHPDHYFGVEVLKQEFPKARFVTTAEGLADIQATGEAKLAQWKPMYKDDLTDAVPTLVALEGSTIQVDGETVRIVELGAGESEHATAVVVPTRQGSVVIAGDALFAGVHAWLAEGRLEGYLDNLKRLEQLDAVLYFPGHAVKAEGQGASLIAANRAYVAAFQKALAEQTTAAAVAAQIKAAYPTYALPIIADIAAGALKPAK
jgi:glyoxylase-like metal-dependent hydrolase (beta-lactamase superfamily II)